VDVNPDDFPALARKIRDGVDREVIGDSIIGMRQAKAGGLLIEVRGDQARFDAVRAEISRSAGSKVEVRALQQRAMVEVRDLDQWSTAKEVAAAIAAATGIPSNNSEFSVFEKDLGAPNQRWYCCRLAQHANYLTPSGSASAWLAAELGLRNKSSEVSAASVRGTQRRSAPALTELNVVDALVSRATNLT